MNEHDATEIAFKNGYEKAVREIIPCKIGDTVYAIRNYHSVKKVMCGKVSEMYFVGKEMQLCIVVHNIARGIWMKDIFPTQELAEKRLIECQTERT